MKVQGRKGFTLIELLIVVVIIGILAAIAIPKFSSTREKAFVSSMKSDLRNLETAQEIYYSDAASNYSYAADIATLEFTESDGVTVAITAADPATGWSAEATHDGTDVVCDIYVGDAAATTNAPGPGVVGCTAL